MESFIGQIKTLPEDFVVEEVPAYPASGEGEHLYLQIQKRDLSHDDMRKNLRRICAISDAEIGCAGIKDKQAVTTQWISIPRTAEEHVGALESAGLTVLAKGYHQNKIRMGHLKENRFQIVIRTDDPDAAQKSAAISESIMRSGIANYYGKQRFGRQGKNAQIGAKILQDPKQARMPKRKQKLLISAWQSELFNQYIDLRLEKDQLAEPVLGDLMTVVETGGLFLLRDVEEEREKWQRGEIVATGPMFGSKVRDPEGVPKEWEDEILAQSEISREQLAPLKKLVPGSRRPLTIRPSEIEIGPHEAGITLSFALPKGAYATTVLEQFITAP